MSVFLGIYPVFSDKDSLLKLLKLQLYPDVFLEENPIIISTFLTIGGFTKPAKAI